MPHPSSQPPHSILAASSQPPNNLLTEWESERFVRTGGALMFDCILKKHQAGLQRGEWLHLIHTLDGDGAGQLSWQTFKRGWMAHMQ